MALRSESRDSHAMEWPCAQKLVVLTRWNSPAFRKSQFSRGGVALRSESCGSHAVEWPSARKVVIGTRWSVLAFRKPRFSRGGIARPSEGSDYIDWIRTNIEK